jgi:hypothetical protein
MPRLTHDDRETIEEMGKDLWNEVFTALDQDPMYSGDLAGRVATATQKAFEMAMTKELEVD